METAVRELHTAFELGARRGPPEDVAGDHRPEVARHEGRRGGRHRGRGLHDARRACASAASPPTRSCPFASERSAGRTIDYGDRDLTVQALNERVDPGLRPRAVLRRRRDQRGVGAALRRRRRRRGRQLVASGACTRTCRWWSPRSTPTRSTAHRGIVANPNCSTMQMVVALKPILDAAGIERVVVSTYQAVSGTGQRAVEELHDQARGRCSRRGAPAAARSIRTRSPSTCCPRWRTSRTATTTRPRSAR